MRKEDLVGVREALASVARPRKRLTELILKAGEGQSSKGESCKEWQLKLFRSPLEFQSDGAGSKVSSVLLGVNKPVGEQVEDTGKREILNTGLVLRYLISMYSILPYPTCSLFQVHWVQICEC